MLIALTLRSPKESANGRVVYVNPNHIVTVWPIFMGDEEVGAAIKLLGREDELRTQEKAWEVSGRVGGEE